MSRTRRFSLLVACALAASGLAACGGDDAAEPAGPAAASTGATGAAMPLVSDPALQAAVDTYQGYVRSQTAVLLEKTREFVAAVKAGDVARARALYPVARTPWERIEPIAEVFGDLEQRIDGREDGLAEGAEFVGFHRLEKELWVTGDLSRSGPIADRLMADVNELVTKANDERQSPLNLANGAKELLDEVATSKITGEEERYSHTDLWALSANVEGSKAAVDALRPALEQRSPALVKQLDEEFAAVRSVLDRHRRGAGWKLYTQLGKADLRELSDAVNALAEPVSKVAATVAR